MGNGRKTTDNRLPLKDNGQGLKDAVNGPVDCLFLYFFVFIPYRWRAARCVSTVCFIYFVYPCHTTIL